MVKYAQELRIWNRYKDNSPRGESLGKIFWKDRLYISVCCFTFLLLLYYKKNNLYTCIWLTNIRLQNQWFWIRFLFIVEFIKFYFSIHILNTRMKYSIHNIEICENVYIGHTSMDILLLSILVFTINIFSIINHFHKRVILWFFNVACLCQFVKYLRKSRAERRKSQLKFSHRLSKVIFCATRNVEKDFTKLFRQSYFGDSYSTCS